MEQQSTDTDQKTEVCANSNLAYSPRISIYTNFSVARRGSALRSSPDELADQNWTGSALQGCPFTGSCRTSQQDMKRLAERRL